jgi:hypothetical protein
MFIEHFLLAYERQLLKNSTLRLIRPAFSGPGHRPRRPYGIMQVPRTSLHPIRLGCYLRRPARRTARNKNPCTLEGNP